MDKQPPPFCIQIELTEGCNLACSFCGIAAIRDNGANGPENIRGKNSSPYKFLTLNLTTFIAKELIKVKEKYKWNPRIEMAMHGEPTMNPEYKQIVEIFRKYLPTTHLQMTTNGSGLLRGDLTLNIDSLMDCGLNVLLLDNYEGINICDKVEEGYLGNHPILKYPKDKKANPHRRRRSIDHDIVITQDIVVASKGNHATLNNHAGSSFPKNNRAEGKRCAKVFREMSIRWDGNVAICCNDWPGFYRCGHVSEGFEKLWQNKMFRAARKKLYHGERNFGPCNGCDALSYRPGLLPDLKGQKEYERANEHDNRIIEYALKEGPYSTAIPRPWE
jgi:radical SAM protein with 4Fe4S-binding SPASM domain